MLQIPFIRAHKDHVISQLAKRHIDVSSVVDNIISLDDARRHLQAKLDGTLAEAKALSKDIGQLYQSGEAQKAATLKEKANQLRAFSKDLNEALNSKISECNQLLYKIPNIPHISVPNGTTDADNIEIFREGSIPTLYEGALPHWEIAKKYEIIDFELGSKITGSGFPVYKGKGARLQRALIAYFLDKNIEAGYTEYQLPHLVNEASGFGTGQIPDKEKQMYYVGDDHLYLIPTTEVPGMNIFREVVLDEMELPVAITGYTPCFRREAGSYGAHVRGLNRLHQFDKVEILRIEHPKRSYKALEMMVTHIKTLLRDLNLPYRIVTLCGGDLGFTVALTYDFEVFSAVQNRWLEVSSVSNCETFQANRLKLKFKNKAGKNELAHTLNGSALALPRVLASILENHQTETGIEIPEVLQPYTGFKVIDTR